MGKLFKKFINFIALKEEADDDNDITLEEMRSQGLFSRIAEGFIANNLYSLENEEENLYVPCITVVK